MLISVHRIGRTGRSGHTGIATTFINKANDESVLLDLKHLLREAKQKIPPFLLELCSENEKYLNVGGIVKLQLFRNYNHYCIVQCNGKFNLQTSKAAATAVVLVTGLQNVRNWKQSRTNRPRILVVVII
jgi:superfamily II DNA/RNA helicase